MKEIYKSEAGKQQVLGSYRQILANWPVQSKQYEVETSFGQTMESNLFLTTWKMGSTTNT